MPPRYLALTEREFYSCRMVASRVPDESLPNGDKPDRPFPAQHDVRTVLGRNVSSARVTASLTMTVVAERSGLSPAYVSQIESGLANPTITALGKLASALGVAIGELVGTGPGTDITPITFDPRVSAAPAATSASSGRGIWDLTAAGSSLLVTRLVRGPAGDHSQPISHPGEELVTVLSGRCLIVIGGLTHELNRFDSCHLAPTQTHQIIDVSEDLLLLVVLTED